MGGRKVSKLSENARKALLVVAMVGLLFGCGCASMNRHASENAELRDRVQKLSESLSSASSESARLAAENAALQDQLALTAADMASKDTELEEARARLAAKGFDVSLRDGVIVVTLPTSILYPSGSALLSPGGKTKLATLATELKGEFAAYNVEVQGHTDTDPIIKTRDKYKSNWELSYDRAQTVAYDLINTGRIKPARVHVAAYGQYAPVASNSSEAGKAKNRRVEIAVLKAAE